MAVLELNNFVAGLPKKPQCIFASSVFCVKLDAAPVGILLRRGNNGQLLYRFNFSDTA